MENKTRGGHPQAMQGLRYIFIFSEGILWKLPCLRFETRGHSL